MFPTIDQAIAQFEGFGTSAAPTITAANNPGAIQAGPFATAQGATGSSGGFAVFPDVATGTAAEDALVSRYAGAGYTLSDLINAWSPPNAPGNSPEATQNYINFVANATGANPNTPVSQLSGQPTSAKPGFSFGCGPDQMKNCGNVDCSNPFTRLFSCCCTVLGGNVTKNPGGLPTSESGCAWYDILCKVNPLGGTKTQSGLLGRVIAIILGFVLIIAGLFQLKSGETIVVTGR